MTRHRWSRWGALACALALALPAAAAPVPGEQDKSLAQVPAKSVIVAHLRGFERTRERLDALLKNAVPDYAAVAKEKMDEALKKALGDRKLEGITKDGPIYLVFTELPAPNQNPPKMAILVPVKDYKQFRDGFLTDDERKNLKTDPLGYENTNIEGTPTYFVNRKTGYAVVTPDADVAALFTKKYDGLGSRLSKPIAQHMTEADVSLYVDMAAVNKQYGDQIKQAQAQLEQLLDNSPDKNVAEMAKRVFAPVFQAVSDSTAVLVTADLRPEGVLLHTEVEVAADSKTNTMLKEWKALPTADLGKLPAGSMVYNSVAYNAAMMKTFGSMTYGIMEPDSDEAKAVKKLVDEMAAAGPKQQLNATNIPASGLTVFKYDDPAKALDAQLRLFKQLKEGSTFGAVLKSAPTVKEKAEKAGGIEFTAVSMKWDLEKTVEKQGAAAGMTDEQKKVMVEYMKSLLGEGLDFWVGTDGKSLVQLAAKDWSAAKALLDRYQKGQNTLGESQAYKDAVKHLPQHNSMVVLTDVPQVTEMMVKSVVTMLQGLGVPMIPPGFEKPAVAAKTSYAGLGLTLESGRGSLDVWVSATSVNDVYKMYIEKLVKPNF